MLQNWRHGERAYFSTRYCFGKVFRGKSGFDDHSTNGRRTIVEWSSNGRRMGQ